MKNTFNKLQPQLNQLRKIERDNIEQLLKENETCIYCGATPTVKDYPICHKCEESRFEVVKP